MRPLQGVQAGVVMMDRNWLLYSLPIPMAFFWSHSLHPEDRGSMAHQTAGILPHN